MLKILSDYYRTSLPSNVVCHYEQCKTGAGFFRVGSEIVCFGSSSFGVATTVERSAQFDAAAASKIVNSEIHLPFDVPRTIENLRMEYYVEQMNTGETRLIQNTLIRNAYYSVREHLPLWMRRPLQRAYFRDWQDLPFPNWPVDCTVDSLHQVFLRLVMQAQGCDKIPFIWFWPEGAPSCLILTHDVETHTGRDFTSTLMDIDLSHGFRAAFQVIPEKRYKFSDAYVNEIRDRGCEFNVHDLSHDGRLFEDKDEFLRRAKKINEYVEKYASRGFRSGAMYRKLDWLEAFEFSYDMSVPNVAHFEPQRGGCCTVMPYFVGKILEMPLTTSQDYTVFHMLNNRTIDLWKKQIALIQQKNGLLSFLSHPDYLIHAQCRAVYQTLLAYLRHIVDRDRIWATLPGEVDKWWRARSAMKLVQSGSGWRVEGPESERARIAYATLDGERLIYSIERVPVMLR